MATVEVLELELSGVATPEQVAEVRDLLIDLRAAVAAGSLREFLQTTPATTWVLVHDLGRAPLGLTVFDGDGIVRPLADVRQQDPDTTLVVFLTPTAGRVVYE